MLPDTLETLTLGERYTVDRVLGRGGMAVVYLARDRKHDRPVAVKVLRPEIVVGQSAERFLLEIQILARLSIRISSPCSTPARPTRHRRGRTTSCPTSKARRCDSG